MTDDQHDQLPLAASTANAQLDDTASFQSSEIDQPADGTETIGEPTVRTAAQKRRRGSRGGRNRKRPAGTAVAGNGDDATTTTKPTTPMAMNRMTQGSPSTQSRSTPRPAPIESSLNGDEPELPKRMTEGRPSAAAAERALVRKPQIGDTRPAPPGQIAAPAAQARSTTRRAQPARAAEEPTSPKSSVRPSRRRTLSADGQAATDAAKKKRRRGVKGPKSADGSVALESISMPTRSNDVVDASAMADRSAVT